MGVLSYLEREIANGNLRSDTAQNACAQSLDNLLDQLSGYEAPKSRLFRKKSIPPRGLYIWGGVGRGKSMLMDVFFEHLTQKKKKRVHFHAFMQDVHKQINIWRKMTQRERRKAPQHVAGAKEDPIAPTAKAIALSADVLCFDEFHVTDIADAMILSRLFTALFERGVVVIATSNRPPHDLYKDGLNRPLFTPFLDLMAEKMVIYPFESDTDHRLRKLSRASVYYTPLTPKTKAALEETWHRLTRPLIPCAQTIRVQGRDLTMVGTPTIVRASFDDLCANALGAADYLGIAHHYSTLILEDIPKMGPENRNEAKRFVTLVDAIYEAKTKLIVSAQTDIENLYEQGDGAFEFERTISRLIEMQSLEYLGASHSADDAPA